MTSPDPAAILAQINAAREQTYQNIALTQAQTKIATDAAEAAARDRSAVQALSQQAVTMDTSVGTRVFAGDEMIFGDTGWRVLPAPDGWSTDTTAGRCAIRRVGQRVEMEMRMSPSPALVGTVRASASGNTFLGVVPSGRGFLTSFRGAVGPTFLSSGNIGVIRLQSGRDARIYWEAATSDTWQESNWITVQMAWTTSDPWPTELPGTPE